LWFVKRKKQCADAEGLRILVRDTGYPTAQRNERLPKDAGGIRKVQAPAASGDVWNTKVITGAGVCPKIFHSQTLF
jgi:hypothetical protein